MQPTGGIDQKVIGGPGLGGGDGVMSDGSGVGSVRYEYKASARAPGEIGCMMEHMGCIGTQAVGDCNIRPWNGGGSCTAGGYACIACTAPEFEEPRHPYADTPKIGGIPVGLPSDMPKAWFMALASLSKAATPERIRTNATADRISVPPTLRVPKR